MCINLCHEWLHSQLINNFKCLSDGLLGQQADNTSAVTHQSLPQRGPVSAGRPDCCSSACQQEARAQRRSQPSGFPRRIAAVTWMQIKQSSLSFLDRTAEKRGERVIWHLYTAEEAERHLSSERQMNPLLSLGHVIAGSPYHAPAAPGRCLPSNSGYLTWLKVTEAPSVFSPGSIL